MLLQITNSCHMMCPHCLHDSVPDGGHMSLQVFNRILQFMLWAKVTSVTVSGGEPTEHPQFAEICQALDNHKISFAICSNGAWCKDDVLTTTVYGVLALKSCKVMQVYSNPKWYKDHEFTMSRESTTFSHPKIELTTSDILSMQDLGRAHTNEQALKEAKESQYFMSCLKGIGYAVQSKDLKHYLSLMEMLSPCKPLVDYKGNFHMSESCLCPSCGNIMEDTYIQLWNKMKNFKPCWKCLNSQKLLNSNSINAIKYKALLKI